MKNICYPTKEGGLGIRRIKDISKAFIHKLWWKFRIKNTLWSQFIHAKYCKDKHPLDISLSVSSSKA